MAWMSPCGAANASALWGKSGSGKSVTFASVMGLIRKPGRIEEGEIIFDGTRPAHAVAQADAGGARARHRHDHAGRADRAQPGADRGAEQIGEMLEAHDDDLPRAGPPGPAPSANARSRC
jgi:ABC-type dipeptide/oligopeptide/nickel transport system ATPase component